MIALGRRRRLPGRPADAAAMRRDPVGDQRARVGGGEFGVGGAHVAQPAKTVQRFLPAAIRDIEQEGRTPARSRPDGRRAESGRGRFRRQSAGRRGGDPAARSAHARACGRCSASDREGLCAGDGAPSANIPWRSASTDACCRPSLPPRPTSFKGSIWRLLDDSAEPAKAIRPAIYLLRPGGAAARRRTRPCRKAPDPRRSMSAGVVRSQPSGVMKSVHAGYLAGMDRVGGDRRVLAPGSCRTISSPSSGSSEQFEKTIRPPGLSNAHGTVQQAALQAG